jgi:MSHA biogenesis protein MshP
MIILIFLLVVIAGMAVYLSTVSSTSQASSASDLNASRAYQAARAGAEWGAYWISPPPPAKASTFKSTCETGPGFTATGTFTLSFPVSNTASLSDFTVTVVCTSAAVYTEGAATVQWYLIVSTGCNTPCTPGTSTYVNRQVSLTITN